jgi:hypothetical protein
MYEAPVPVYDRGKWIADLDLLDAFFEGSHDLKHEWCYKVGCSHEILDPPADEELPTTINSWEEFLDNPTDSSIVMTHKNWPIRLAIATLAMSSRLQGERI